MLKTKIVVEINSTSNVYCFNCSFFNNNNRIDEELSDWGNVDFCYRFIEDEETFQEIYDKKRCPQCLAAEQAYKELEKK